MFKKILLPIDLNDLEMIKATIEKVVLIASEWKAELCLLYVMPIVPASYLEFVPIDFELEEKKRKEEELENLAAELKIKVGDSFGDVSTKIRSGGIYYEVLEEATEIKADLIICASHCPTLATYLVGSQATNIVRHASCSVLVIR